MNDTRDVDIRISELLRSELPTPEHAEGYWEHAAALLTAEAVERANRKAWLPELRWLSTRRTEQQSATMRRVAPRRAQSRRPAVVASVAALLVLAVAIGGVVAVRQLEGSTMVLRITDETIIDASDPAVTHTTIVATSLVSLGETRTMIQGLIAAINANDPAAVARFYASNAWLENPADQTNIQLSVLIAQYWQRAHETLGLRVEPLGDPVPYDRYVAQPVRYVLPSGSPAKTGVQVFQIDTSGHITHEWLTGWIDE
jgi:hypothetical protein